MFVPGISNSVDKRTAIELASDHRQALNRTSKTIYVVIGQEIGGLAINAGLGRG